VLVIATVSYASYLAYARGFKSGVIFEQKCTDKDLKAMSILGQIQGYENAKKDYRKYGSDFLHRAVNIEP